MVEFWLLDLCELYEYSILKKTNKKMLDYFYMQIFLVIETLFDTYCLYHSEKNFLNLFPKTYK